MKHYVLFTKEELCDMICGKEIKHAISDAGTLYFMCKDYFGNKEEVENDMIIDMAYYYKGSSNVQLKLIEKPDGIDLVTDFGETITTVTTGYGLMRVLEDLYNEKYA